MNEYPKLIIRVINFELVQPICSQYRTVRDGRTDGRTTYDSNTAPCSYVHRAAKMMLMQRLFSKISMPSLIQHYDDDDDAHGDCDDDDNIITLYVCRM